MKGKRSKQNKQKRLKRQKHGRWSFIAALALVSIRLLRKSGHDVDSRFSRWWALLSGTHKVLSHPTISIMQHCPIWKTWHNTSHLVALCHNLKYILIWIINLSFQFYLVSFYFNRLLKPFCCMVVNCGFSQFKNTVTCAIPVCSDTQSRKPSLHFGLNVE